MRTLAEGGVDLHLAGADPLHHDAGPARGGARAAQTSSRVTKLMISSAPARRDTKLAIMEISAIPACSSSTARPKPAGSPCCTRTSSSPSSARSGANASARAPIRLLDPRTATRCRTARPASSIRRNPYTFDGYWKLPEKTAEAFRGDYCTVGDIARRDADGYIYLVDRKSNMIISGGENVYPSEVEAVLGAHPAGEGRGGDRRCPTRNGASAFTP